MKEIEKITGGVVYPKQTNDLIDNTEELDKRVIENKASIQNLESKVIKNSEDISSNYTNLNKKINNLQTGGGSIGEASSDNSYMDFDIEYFYKANEPETHKDITCDGVLRIQGGMFQLYIDLYFNNTPVLEELSELGLIIYIKDKNDYIRNILETITAEEVQGTVNGTIMFEYYTPNKESKIKSTLGQMLLLFNAASVIIFPVEAGFELDPDIKKLMFIGSGLIGEYKI